MDIYDPLGEALGLPPVDTTHLYSNFKQVLEETKGENIYFILDISGENNPMYGKDPWNKGLTKDTSSMLIKIGKKSKETKASNIGFQTGANNHFYGCKHSEETILKMRKPRSATINIKHQALRKKKLVYEIINVETGEKEIMFMTEWCSKYNINPENARGSIYRGKYKKWLFIPSVYDEDLFQSYLYIKE